MDYKTELAKHRAATGKTLEAMASAIGVDKSTWLRWENGEYPVPIKRVPAVQKLTGLSRKKIRPDVYGAAS